MSCMQLEGGIDLVAEYFAMIAGIIALLALAIGILVFLILSVIATAESDIGDFNGNGLTDIYENEDIRAEVPRLD